MRGCVTRKMAFTTDLMQFFEYFYAKQGLEVGKLSAFQKKGVKT